MTRKKQGPRQAYKASYTMSLGSSKQRPEHRGSLETLVCTRERVLSLYQKRCNEGDVLYLNKGATRISSAGSIVL